MSPGDVCFAGNDEYKKKSIFSLHFERMKETMKGHGVIRLTQCVPGANVGYWVISCSIMVQYRHNTIYMQYGRVATGWRQSTNENTVNVKKETVDLWGQFNPAHEGSKW